MTFWVAGGVAVGAIGGALISSDAAKSAANKQADATSQATQTQMDMYNQTRQDNMPLLNARNDALTKLESVLGVGGSAGKGVDPTTDPGYQFGLNQGQAAIGRQMAAHGMSDSGAAYKAAARYANDYATTKYDDAFNRIVNPLQSLAGLGQSGANSLAASGSSTANAISGLQSSLGNAQAASSLAQANTWANTANQLAGWYQNYSRSNPGGGYTYGGSVASNMPDNIDAGGGWNPSDVRLKTSIVRVGTSPKGYGLYEWTWNSTGLPGRGVIAQEVAVRDPSAVRFGADGFMQVDYSKV